MPLTEAGPTPQAVVGRPIGNFALKRAAPAAERESSAAIESCGLDEPESSARSDPSEFAKIERTSSLKPPGVRFARRKVARSAPLCGLPIVVTDATRSGLTDAT